MSDPADLGPEAGSAPGVDALRGLLHAGLANVDERDELRAQLAEAVPSVENGLWQVLPDGRMETTWKIRQGARWHDGTPFTSADVLFTAQIIQDREFAAFSNLPGFRNPAYQSVESVEAPDPLTIVVRWKELNIDADRLFGTPLPRHLLETAAAEDKASLAQHLYWSQQFIGTGAFKLREWAPGSHVLIEANDAYVLGRPKIDRIEVKLIPADQTLLTNVLAGVVELPLGRTLSFDQALDLRTRWQQGRVEIVPRPGWSVIHPQLTYTQPPIVAEVRFRQALLQAIDRQELVDTLMGGFSEVAEGLLPVGRPQYADIKARAPRFPYDPRRAQQLLEELGAAKSSDGIYRDRAGQRIEVEIRTSAENDNNVKLIYPIVHAWQRLGVGAEATLVPAQQRDREYQATFPGFILSRVPNDADRVGNYISSRTPTRENNWVGGNPAGYQDPSYDALYSQYIRTISIAERMDLLGRLVHQLAGQMVTMGLYYDNLAAPIGNRLQNVVVPQQYGSQYTWSAHLWDVRPG
jgi:peptide/nickel transport system substrate-binding protein